MKIHVRVQVDSAYYRGDILGAQSASRSARNWNIAGIIFGSVALVVVIVIISVTFPLFIMKDDTSNTN